MLQSARLPAVLEQPPQPHEIEVSIFGPGLGECVLVHLGDNEWVVVDSCIDPVTKNPVALDYFSRIGVNPATSIAVIVASHWHDDHVRGISKVLNAAKQAKFIAASATTREEFHALTLLPPPSPRFSSGVSELAETRRIVEERRTAGGFQLGLAVGGRLLLRRPGLPINEVWSLSPSDEDTIRGLQHLANLVAPPGAVYRVPSMEPNDLSVVLQLQSVAGSILLGGDLEHYKRGRSRGWHAVIDQGERPPGKSAIFKISHHGSYNGDCPEIWEHMLEKEVISILSPFQRGSVSLPRQSDVERIRKSCDRAYLTSNRRARSTRSPDVQKMIRQSTKSFTPRSTNMGHVQVRFTGTEWLVRGTECAARL
ncbi:MULTISPECIES: MBL fold metallo-hydrolase [Streptomyces]|uniref:MBL fold metallo-hydrolase n=1 Tax=Streptomyces TaxID=1883 RepID=UPI0036E8C26F